MRRSIAHYVNKAIHKDDPVLIPVWDNPSLLTIRLYVDPEEGNDNNDGLTWETAKRTLYSVQKLIPFDLKGVHVLILMHPGVYTLTDRLSFNHINGVVRFVWVGEYINSADTPYAIWVRNGAVNPVRNSNQVIIELTQDHFILESRGRTCEYTFNQNDFSKGYSEAGFCYWDRFVIKCTGVSKLNLYGCIFGHDSGFTLDCSEKGNGVPIETNNAYIFWNAGRVLGADTGVAQESGVWRGAFWFGPNTDVELKKAAIGFAEGYSPVSGKQFEIINFKQLCANGTSNVNFNVILPSGATYFDAGITGLTAPVIFLGVNSKGAIRTNQSQVAITDTSISPHDIEDYSTNKSTSFISPGLLVIDNNVISKTKNAVPGDSLLSNESLCFYLDQTNNKLMVKTKYSNGTVKVGEINLL